SEGLETGADDYLFKPIQNRELVARIDSFLRHKTSIDNLIKSEEHFRVTLDSIGDAVIATDTKGRITRMNPVAAELTGWSLEEANNEKLENVFNIENAQTGDKVENPVSKVLKTGGLVGLANHTKLISKNGKEFQIADSAAPIKNDEGAIIGVVLVFRDVTEEYNVQQLLKENEERFRVIVEGAPDPIFIQSDMKFAYLNPAACRLFGIKSANELLGKPVMERFHPDYHEKVRQRIHNLNEKRNPVHQLLQQKFIRIDGSEIWVETAGEPISYRGQESALVFVRDISQRVTTEQELKESEERFRLVMENSLDAILITSPDGSILNANKAACGMF
ncbi:MAG: PAS domain S-box protein, partial [Bacteroidales bacterium]|nr:PAS domain S-box protein [Bacteroidales bacterium]